MKRIYIKVLLLAFLFQSCTTGFEDIVNSNNTTTAPPSVLFTGVTRATFAGTAEAGQQAAQFFVHYNGGALDEITYFFQRNSFAEYNTLRNVERLILETERQDGAAHFIGLAKFLKAYLFVQLTQKVGDIPYSEALKANSDITKPKYDNQKAIYLGVLQELEEANDLIPASGQVVGDIMYDGSLLKWKKLVNTFRLRVLMSLSLKETDVDLNIKEQFKTIVENPSKYPIMQSNADNAAFRYFDITGAKHFWASSTDPRNYRMCTTLGDILKSNQDPRIKSFFEVPSSPANLNPNVITNYKSIDHGVPTATSTPLQASTSPLSNRYIGNAIGEPYLQVSYHELCFILAEAAYREWIGYDAATLYHEGIKSSCLFYNIPESEINTFLNGPVKYNAADGLVRINNQRWVGYFMNSGYEAYWNHRRTRAQGFDVNNPNRPLGIPAFRVGIVNRNDGKLPNRFQYPLNEAFNNESNLEEAIQNQFGTDDINGVLWIQKK